MMRPGLFGLAMKRNSCLDSLFLCSVNRVLWSNSKKQQPSDIREILRVMFMAYFYIMLREYGSEFLQNAQKLVIKQQFLQKIYMLHSNM